MVDEYIPAAGAGGGSAVHDADRRRVLDQRARDGGDRAGGPGRIKVGEPVEIVGLQEKSRNSVVTGVEMFHKLLDEGLAGDNLGLLLRGIERTDVERGQVVAKPGSITPHKKFMSQVYVLKKEEGGRHKAFFNGYRPQFYIRTMDVTGNISLPKGVEMVMPGDDVNLEVELIIPVALEQGSKFAIREGGLTVGAGVITKISRLGRVKWLSRRFAFASRLTIIECSTNPPNGLSRQPSAVVRASLVRFRCLPR